MLRIIQVRQQLSTLNFQLSIQKHINSSVRRLPLRAEVTFYSVKDYATFRYLSLKFRKCRMIVPNVTLCAFRARCCVVLCLIVFRYVSLIFPFLKGRTMGKRANNDRINDDTWKRLHECLCIVDMLIRWYVASRINLSTDNVFTQSSIQRGGWVEGRKKKTRLGRRVFFVCDSCRIQTCNLLIRSQMLYSVELRSHLCVSGCLSLESGCKDTTFFISGKFFFDFFL